MKPIIQKRDKNLSISVFPNNTPDGKAYYSIQLQRSYMKKGQQDWTRETINLFTDDLLPLAQLASDTYTKINEERAVQKFAKTDRNSYDPDNLTDVPF